jgi:hypothetical protein
VFLVNRNLYSTFITPWADQSAAHTVEPDYHLPGCYNVQPPPPGPNKATAFSDETLFFMFYSSPRDALQEVAAQELWVTLPFMLGSVTILTPPPSQIQPQLALS